MKQQYADIIVDITQEKLDRTFQYKVPENLKGKLTEGMPVEVPFGRGSRMVKGYVVGFSEKPEIDTDKIKEIHAVLERELGAETGRMMLAAWMRQQYGGTMIQAIKTVIPVKQKQRPKEKKTVRLFI